MPKPEKLRFDLDSESFDLYFQKQLEGKKIDFDSLPRTIVAKLLRGGGEKDSISTSRMSGLEKIYVLWKALNQRVFIVVEDDVNGIGFEQYVNLRKKGAQESFKEDSKTPIPSIFVQADKELSDIFSYYNQAFNTPHYRHFIGIKNRTPNRIAKWKKESKYIIRLLLQYEAIKYRATKEMGMELAEIFALMYLYDEEERQATPLYKDKFFRVHGAGAGATKAAFIRLNEKGLISKTGNTSNAKYKITPLGTDKVNEFFKKYVVK